MKEIILLLVLGFRVAFSTRQCCPNNEVMIKGYCGNSTIKVDMNCTNGKLVLRDIILDGDKLSTADSPGFIFAEDPNTYCVGEVLKNQSSPNSGKVSAALICFEKAPESDIETSGVLVLVSAFFLVATFAFYMYFPQMRDLQGLCYMCMCICMALGYLLLGLVQLHRGFRTEICSVLGFLMYFWMMATFFWTNVISVNVYRTVIDSAYMKRTERKQFLIYSLYAWGCSTFFLIVALSTNFAEGSHWKPGIGEESCWFHGRTETWIFFYGPVAVLVVSNIVLFVMSSFNLWRHTRKYEVNTLNNLKHRFLLSLKLFLVMGISWIFEIASFAHAQSLMIWKIMDIFNCLQGIIIFVILVVFRKRAMQALADEGCCLIFTRPLAEKLNPHDDDDDQKILADETMEVRLN